MRAMILAAGRGERMGKLTQFTPKPLLRVGDKYLIDYALLSLKKAGITEVVINIFYHGDQIKEALGNGARYGMRIAYSEEKERLETGGGVQHALPLLGKDPFLVVSGDVITDFPLNTLPRQLASLAHLVLVPNPPFHPSGDFGLEAGRVTLDTTEMRTFGNIGVYHPDLFAGCEPGYFPLSKLIYAAIRKGEVTGEYFAGKWFNVGTPEQLGILNIT